MFMIIWRQILFFLLIVLNLVSSSQSRRFSHLTSEDGISQSEVYSFLKDSKGFVWFGTIDGLNKYDGYNIKVYNTNKNAPHGLSNNTVRSLVEDHLGRIWIGTNVGLNMYDPETEIFYQIAIESSENNKNVVWSLLIYEGQLFVGTNSGLWTSNIETNNFKKIEANFRKIKNLNSSIRSLKKSRNGGIWILAETKLLRIEPQKSNIEPVLIDEFHFTEFGPGVDIAEDFSGNMWIAMTRDGLIRYNPNSTDYKHFSQYGTKYGPVSNKSSSIAIDKNGNLWLGSIDKGLSYISADDLYKEEPIFESVQQKPLHAQGLNSNLIFSLYISNDNLLWIGTIGSGVNIYNPNQKKIAHYKFRDVDSDTPNSNFIRSVFVDRANNIWTGTHNNGLFLLNRETEKFQKLGFETQSIFYIKSYTENKAFICTSKGIYLIEIINNKIKILSNLDELTQNSAVFYVTNSQANVFWIATINGLIRAEIDNNTITAKKTYTSTSNPNLSINNCRVMLYNDVKNELLVGTEGGGLNILSLDKNHYPQKIEAYKKSEATNSLSNDYIRTIVKDKNQNIWIGTYEGLNKMVYNDPIDKISFESFTKTDGLPNNMIQVIVEDNFNSLWIGTNGGLSQFNPEKSNFINYTKSDGIQSNEFSEHSVFKKPDGEIIISGINGINAFYPKQIEPSSQEPQTTITDFYLFNEKVVPNENVGRKVLLSKSVILTDSIILVPKQNNIGFDFSAMIYPNSEKVKYAYMLEGFDEDWQYTDANDRNANYTNLRHGKYIFRVRSTNNDGIWEDARKEIFIHIKTPFVLTWVALMLYGLAIVIVFLYFSYFTVIRYTTKNKMLLEQNHNQKIHELDETRTRFFINISHDLRTPLTLISGPLKSLMQNSARSIEDNEKLQLIKRNVKRLNYLVEQLLDVRKAETGKLKPKLKSEDIVSFTKNETDHFIFALNQKSIDLTIESNLENVFVCFDKAMISKVFFNIISNAIKYTDKGRIAISFEKVENKNYKKLKNTSFNSFVKVEIQDTGKGIPSKQIDKIFERYYQDVNQNNSGYGIGLSHSKELIDAHNGFIEVESIEGAGSKISFFLPDVEISEETEKISSYSVEDIYYNEETVSSKSVEDEQVKKGMKSLLIVEDNIDMRNYIASELKETYNVNLANDGVEGLKAVNVQNPDIIISDVMMPNMDGMEFCKKIKSNLKTSHIPIILLTAKTDRETKHESIETGADDYIPKPFDIDYLKKRIKNLLLSRETLRNHFQGSINLDPSLVTVTSIDERFLSTLLEAIEKGISESDFSVSTLETKMGMSHANFYRKVTSLTGQSGQDLLQSMRLKRAHQIMSDNVGMRINEVAYMVGFTNPNYFGKCFKKMFGMTPSEFVKSNPLSNRIKK